MTTLLDEEERKRQAMGVNALLANDELAAPPTRQARRPQQRERVSARLSTSSIPEVAKAGMYGMLADDRSRENRLDREAAQGRAETIARGQSASLAARLMKDRQRMLEKMNAGKKLTTPELRELRDNEAALQQMGHTLERAQGEDFTNRLVDTTMSGLQALGLNSAANVLEGWTYDTPEKQVRNDMRRIVAKIRKSELGSAMSQAELALGAGWDPSASGIGNEEALRRLTTLQNFLQGKQDTLRETQRDYEQSVYGGSGARGLDPDATTGLSGSARKYLGM